MTDFGDELRRLLAERGISLSAAAREAGCSKGYLSNAANGRKLLTPRVAAGLDRFFGTGDRFAAYAMLRPPDSTGSGNSCQPRTHGVHVSAVKTANDADARNPAAKGAADPEGRERLGYVLAHPVSADLVAVAHLREQVRRLDERYDLRCPAPSGLRIL
jgi:transcriptional regulator with XRE-family HTH domain